MLGTTDNVYQESSNGTKARSLIFVDRIGS